MNIVLQKRIENLGLILPPAPKPMGVYRPLLVVGKYLYVSGQGPLLNNRDLITGKVGGTLDRDQNMWRHPHLKHRGQKDGKIP